jgi:hypothetical protein
MPKESAKITSKENASSSIRLKKCANIHKKTAHLNRSREVNASMITSLQNQKSCAATQEKIVKIWKLESAS